MVVQDVWKCHKQIAFQWSWSQSCSSCVGLRMQGFSCRGSGPPPAPAPWFRHPEQMGRGHFGHFLDGSVACRDVCLSLGLLNYCFSEALWAGYKMGIIFCWLCISTRRNLVLSSDSDKYPFVGLSNTIVVKLMWVLNGTLMEDAEVLKAKRAILVFMLNHYSKFSNETWHSLPNKSNFYAWIVTLFI